MTTILDVLNTKISPEQQAIWDASRRRWDAGLEAGKAGLPMPDGAEPMAYKSGIARRRVAAGEIVGFVMRSCKCNACGESNYEWRVGCRCWSSLVPGDSKYSMTYGYQVEAGSDPADHESTFMSGERILDLAAQGREVIDIMTGKPVPVET